MTKTHYDEILPVTRFKREMNRVMKRAKQGPYTVLITRSGKSVRVFMDAASYHQAVESAQRGA